MPSVSIQIRLLRKATYIIIMCICLFLLAEPVSAAGRKHLDRQLLERLYAWPRQFDSLLTDTIRVNSYTKYSVEISRKNATLMMLPPLFYLAKDGERDFFFEFYGRMNLTPTGITKKQSQAMFTTLYKKRRLLDNVNQYHMPYIYQETMSDGNILSPFVRINRKYYRISTYSMPGARSLMKFRGKVRNTQLVHGYAVLDDKTGRVLWLKMEGEYDMVHFIIDGQMGASGISSLFVCSSRIAAKVSCFGNSIYLYGDHILGNWISLPDDYNNHFDRELMDSIRPLLLNPIEKRIIAEYDSAHEAKIDTVKHTKKRENWMKKVFWDILGDNMFNKIQTNFGVGSKASLRIGPIFNPLYFGYSNSKGVVYKLDMRGRYSFTSNSDISLRLRGGYSFRQRRLYYTIPVYYYFNRRRNGYLQTEFGNGNRITNSEILDDIKQYKRNDSINWDAMNLQYFKDMHFTYAAHYDLSEKFSVKAGIMIHKRTAVNSAGYHIVGKPASYKTVAPLLELQYRPWGYKGRMSITADWEKGMKGFLGGEIPYSRFEFDASWVKDLKAMRTLSLRTGSGFYVDRAHDVYFLDYSNFRENNVPGGWEDEWVGEFELLNSNWYNASSYYIRSNATYQSPLLLLSYVPLIGRIVEKERIYLNILTVSKLNPYMELGYGMTNRAFSIGVFTGFSPHRFEGVGVKFGFELFNNW